MLHESERLGAGVAVSRILPDLERYGWSFSASLPGPGPLFEDLVKCADVTVIDRPIAYSVEGFRKAPGMRTRLVATPSYARSVAELLRRKRPHVVHANSLLSLPEAVLAHRMGFPTVLHVHESGAGTKFRAAALLGRFAADVILVVSEKAADDLRPMVPSSRIVVAPNGVPLQSPMHREDNGDVVVGTVGAVSRRKGTDLFVAAASEATERVPDLLFEHIGPSGLSGDSTFDDDILGVTRDSREHSTRIQFVGPSRHPADLMKRWSIFVMPSRDDPFPLATLEAMSMGLPVIAFSVGGIPEQISHLVDGVLVEPGDFRTMAAWIARLAEDKDLRMRLGRSARETVERRFTLTRQAEQVHLAYLQAVNRRFAPRAYTGTKALTDRWLS